MTMTTDDDLSIPDDITAGLRQAAAAVPHADLHPTTPTVRLRARRRRRCTLGAVGLAAAVLAAVVAIRPFDVLADDAVDVRVGPADGSDRPGDDPAPEDPSDPSGGQPPELPVEDGLPADFGLPTLLMPNVWSELLPDGSIREIPGRPAEVLPDAALADAVRLSDGRTVTLTIQPPDGVSSEDYREGDGVYVLSVFDDMDSLVDEREVRTSGEAVMLGGEHEGAVILLHQTTAGNVDVVSVDPGTFVETPLTTADTWTARVDLQAGVLAMVNDPATAPEQVPGCQLQAVELAEGTVRQVDVETCSTVYDVSVSPDGGHATVIYEGNVGRFVTMMVAVVDLWDTGSVVGTASLGGESVCPLDGSEGMPGCTLPREIGLGWKDEQTWFVIVQDYDPAAPGRVGAWGPELDPEHLRALVASL